jgi:uncharacterized protein
MEIRHLILCLTTRCNLACAYCYHGGGGEKTDISDEILSEALRLAGSGSKPLHVQLTGGEPTLRPERIIQAVRAIRDLPRPTTIGIQTNATLLTQELADFLRHYQVQMGISLDGPPAIQERLRGRTADTLRGLSILESRRIPFRVTTVVSRENARQLDRLVLALAGFRWARGIGLDLLVKKGRANTSSLLTPRPSELRKGVSAMVKALSAVNAHRSHPLILRELELLRRPRPAGNRPSAFCRAARGQSLAVHPDGRLFPCSQCLGEDAFGAGDVWDPAPAGLMRMADHRLIHGGCPDCPVNGFCPGDCPSRIFHNREQEKPLVCTLYRTLWESELHPREDSLTDEHPGKRRLRHRTFNTQHPINRH